MMLFQECLPGTPPPHTHTSAFPCLNNPPLNTDGANALGGFRALLRRGYSTNMRETCRNVPGTLVCPLFFMGRRAS